MCQRGANRKRLGHQVRRITASEVVIGTSTIFPLMRCRHMRISIKRALKQSEGLQNMHQKVRAVLKCASEEIICTCDGHIDVSLRGCIIKLGALNDDQMCGEVDTPCER